MSFWSLFLLKIATSKLRYLKLKCYLAILICFCVFGEKTFSLFLECEISRKITSTIGGFVKSNKIRSLFKINDNDRRITSLIRNQQALTRDRYKRKLKRECQCASNFLRKGLTKCRSVSITENHKSEILSIEKWNWAFVKIAPSLFITPLVFFIFTIVIKISDKFKQKIVNSENTEFYNNIAEIAARQN